MDKETNERARDLATDLRILSDELEQAGELSGIPTFNSEWQELFAFAHAAITANDGSVVVGPIGGEGYYRDGFTAFARVNDDGSMSITFQEKKQPEQRRLPDYQPEASRAAGPS